MKTETPENLTEGLKKLGELIKDIGITMLTTQDPDGSLRSRPMASQEMDAEGNLWFFTSKASGKIHSIIVDQKVNLSYASGSTTHPVYVSIAGHAEMVEDREKAKELWKPIYKAWFPEGLEDPDLVLLRVRIDDAEYWDAPSGAVVQLIGLAKVAITGEPYKSTPAEHGKIDIRH